MGIRGQSSSHAEVAEDPRIDGVIRALEKIGNLMGRQAQERAATVAQAAQATVTATNGANNGNNGNNGNGNCQMHQLVEQFLKLKPTKFEGKGDPEAATHWVEELEKAFELLGCTEEKVTLAMYQLQGNASDWWKATRVDQYETEFARLSKFAPRMAENPLDKARRLRDGLKSELRSQLILLNLRDYNVLNERAQMVEGHMTERAAASGSRYAPAMDNRNFGKKPMTGNKRFVPSIRKNLGKLNRYSNAACQSCGRRHKNGPLSEWT
ncbi:uncharacterized protein LOC130134843 [Syzygium oleosum]|uniref:uncharacterized protein LOC130134843 n=1 Tax=Syzygium oleosum TaxID=219896 RepID=UPI0024B995F9|nr:uncharacterized protein LOC130134843 [Syzygium oleosum]